MMQEPSKQINSKKEYYTLARRHLLGNTIRQWTADEFLEQFVEDERVFPKLLAVRNMTIASKDLQATDLDIEDVRARINWAVQKGFVEEILIDEQAPDHLSTLKGEVMRDEHYWYLRYDMTPGLRMRPAMTWEGPPEHVIPPRPRGMAHVSGLRAVELIREKMDQIGWETLNDIFDRYPESIVEFSCYSCRIGWNSSNVIFWEVRNY